MLQFVGPFPFDYTAVSASGRGALNKVGHALRDSRLHHLLHSLGSGMASPATPRPGEGVRLGVAVGEDLVNQVVGGVEQAAEAVVQAEQRALGAGAAASGAQLAALPKVEPHEPGLYILLRGPEGSPDSLAIAGFWVVFGANYLDEGTLGPPDKHPPYANGLLEAATEEVWWRTLRVDSETPGSWRPLIVLEWLEPLAVRSALSPPGIPGSAGEDGAGGATGEDGVWLDELEPELVDAWDDEWEPKAPRKQIITRGGSRLGGSAQHANVGKRSVLAVVRGELAFDRTLHRGSFHLLPVSTFTEGATVDEWVDAALKAPVPADESQPDPHALSAPITLPAGRTGFASSGWLTRGLDVWPPRASEVKGGVLTARVVRTKWKGQLMQAAVAMFTVLALVISLAVGVRLAAEPPLREVKVTPPPAPQPAMSVCSADHQPFVDEFRCQIEYLANTNEPFPAGKVCRDGRGAPVPSNGRNLQAAYCGLLDRAQDNWLGNRHESDKLWNFGHLAAAQACLNVLGEPYKYKQSRRTEGHAVADPSKFLEDEALAISPLVELTEELEGACESYRVRVEGRIEGAVFATHVGGPLAEDYVREPEPSALRRLVVDQAMSSMGNDATRCFMAGVDAGLAGATYDTLCGDPDPVDKKHNTRKIWRLLYGGGPQKGEASVITQYVHARFGLGNADMPPRAIETSNELWQCHLALEGEYPHRVGARVSTLWDLTMPVPQNYNVNGAGIMTQLMFDAAMRRMGDGLDGGVCWGLVRKRLSAYQPVHPLLGEVDDAGWPSVEQQVCGQVCAVAYRVAGLPEGAQWVTPYSDLDACTYLGPPSDSPDMGRGKLDLLRLPWNGAQRLGWQGIDPDLPKSERDEIYRRLTAGVCSFNLIAQDFLPAEAGYIPGGRAPVQWAGETASGSGIAGGPEGLVTMAIEGMHRYGTGSSWSKGPCSYVATQCFTALMAEVMGPQTQNTKRLEPYEWLDRWEARVREVSSRSARDLSTTHPWCAPLQPYLGVTQAMAQFDEPCRQGVEEARDHVKAALTTLASRGNP